MTLRVVRVLRALLIGFIALVVLAYAALVAYAYWPRTREALPVEQLAKADDRFIEVEGLKLRYREYGSENGSAGAARPQLILIHGFANSLQSWRSLAPLLADCCHVFAVDLPGFGLSAKPVEHSYYNDSQGHAMVAFAHAVGVTRPIYIGHSLGGTIALHSALEDRNTAGLVLLNPGIINTGVPKIVEYQFFPLPRLSALQFGDRSFRESFVQRSFTDPSIITPAVMDDLMLASRSEGYLEGMTAMMGQYRAGDEIAMLARVKVPTLIIWGALDRRPADEPDELQRRVAGSELVRITDAGHYSHEERPAEVAAVIARVLATWPGTAVAAPQ